MSIMNWQKQDATKPLFPDLQWSRPENSLHAGKLCIVGGNLYGFSSAASSYGFARDAGIGRVAVVLPNAIEKTTSPLLPDGVYAPSTPSGSFARAALAGILECGNTSDGMLLAGDLGRNSETAVVLERIIDEYKKPLCVTKDALDITTPIIAKHGAQENHLIVGSFAQLQKLMTLSKMPHALHFDMGLVKLVERLNEYTSLHSCSIITVYQNAIVVSCNGQASVTRLETELKIWRSLTASYMLTWFVQQPNNWYQALTTAAFEIASRTTPGKA